MEIFSSLTCVNTFTFSTTHTIYYICLFFSFLCMLKLWEDLAHCIVRTVYRCYFVFSTYSVDTICYLLYVRDRYVFILFLSSVEFRLSILVLVESFPYKSYMMDIYWLLHLPNFFGRYFRCENDIHHNTLLIIWRCVWVEIMILLGPDTLHKPIGFYNFLIVGCDCHIYKFLFFFSLHVFQWIVI